MSRGRDSWLARRSAADRIIPRASVSRATALRRLPGGWTITISGQSLSPLGGPGRVEVGGTTLQDVRFTGDAVTGRLRSLPARLEVTVDLGVSRLEGITLDVDRRIGNAVVRALGEVPSWLRRMRSRST